MALELRSGRVRSGMRKFAMVAFALLLPAAAWSAWDYIEARRLARIVAAVEQKGEPASAGFAAAPGAHARDNAARYYDAAAALLTDGGASPLALERIREWPVPDRAAAAALVQGWLDENREAEALLTRAGELPFAGYRSREDATARGSGLFRLATLAHVRGFERAAAGDRAGVASALSRELRVAHARGRVSAGWSPYIALSMASRALWNFEDAVGASDALLGTLQEDIRRVARDDVIEAFALGERASLLGQFWRSGANWYATPANFRSSAVWPIVRPYMAHVAVALAHDLEAFLEQARRPWPDRIGPHVPAEPWPRWRIGYLTVEYGVASQRRSHYLLTKWAVIALAELRAADATLAVERFRRQHDRLPASLDEAVPAYLPAVPIDPFSGAPLKYLVTGREFTVYSVGENRTDEQGSSELWQFEREMPRKKDLGFRIPLSR